MAGYSPTGFQAGVISNQSCYVIPSKSNQNLPIPSVSNYSVNSQILSNPNPSYLITQTPSSIGISNQSLFEYGTAGRHATPTANLLDTLMPNPQQFSYNASVSTGSPQLSSFSQNPAFGANAPNLCHMQILGYEQLTFNEEIVMPPSAPVWEPDVQIRDNLSILPTFTEDDVHDAVISYANKHCCYGSGVAKKMSIKDIEMMSAFHYKLETFGEKRKSTWSFVPYTGQIIDGPMNGPAPQVWDIFAAPEAYFKNSSMKMEVPHTAFVKPCHTCIGNCRVRCEICAGNGRECCNWCGGCGKQNDEICSHCNSTGLCRCETCLGHGQVKCQTCNGTGQLKYFVELIVTWENHVDNFISETSNLPQELIHDVSGKIVLKEENIRVCPIQSSNQSVCTSSKRLLDKHSTAYPNERILKQRHSLCMIPIAEVNYEWKKKIDQFYVYGLEHNVYFKRYPQNCYCCRCTIL